MGWLSLFAEVLFPSLCPACRTAAGPQICPACIADIQLIDHACPWCAAPKHPNQRLPCQRCHDTGLPNLKTIQVLGVYAGVLQKLINDSKAGAHAPALRALAQFAAQRAPLLAFPRESEIQVAVVPPNRGRRAGPHLATALGRAIAQARNWPWRPVLHTTRTAAVQHDLPANLRRQAVDGLFTCGKPVKGTFLLVDDILTSGSTLAAAAKALRQAGAKRIYGFCLARTPRGDDPKPHQLDAINEDPDSPA